MSRRRWRGTAAGGLGWLAYGLFYAAVAMVVGALAAGAVWVLARLAGQ